MVMRLLDRKGWTLTQWMQLSDDEKYHWLAYEELRIERIIELRETLGTAGKNGKSLLSPEAWTQIMLQGL